MPRKKYTLKINGKKKKFRAYPDEPLLWILRDQLGLTGTKFGCGEGVCGACSVLIDGEVRRSCRLPVSSLKPNQDIVTIEGLAKGGKLTALQQAFIDHTAFQCGFCTPGMIIAATALLVKTPHPSRVQIANALDGNLCRCGSHVNIIEAIQAVAAANQG
jgi:aerobic-type carbon monoxide dehydrogenase small subunit (CoxS/CutS family)